jgi:cytochrome P450 family 4
MLQELIVFMIAGSDTSSTTLSWFIYYMSKYPRVQQKIKEELMDTYDHKRLLSIDHIESLVYLDVVIKEVLRITPPFDGTFRTLTNDDRLPGSGTQLYQGDQVYISFYNLSRDPQHWSIDPQLFYPERFLEEDKSHHPYASTPFGAGHRQCMGQDFARFQLKVIITRLMQYVTFHDSHTELNTGGYITQFSTIPKHLAVTITFD